jgi:hypothetical protein
MKTILFAAAALALCAGAADAAPKAKTKANALVGPEQPIPYARVQAYSKASTKARATTDWWAGAASPASGAAVDVSAKASAGPPAKPAPR